MSASPAFSTRLARPDDDRRGELTALINASYREGELGIFVDTDEQPFLRFTSEELLALVLEEKVIVVEGDDDNGIVGCIKIEPRVHDETAGDMSIVVGEWGGLAVAKPWQGQGLGTVLRKAAEKRLMAVHGCTHAELELLTPSNWEHEHKERLRRWYVDRLGFALKVPGDYEASTTRFPSGSLLMDRMLLCTDADFTVYRRAL